MKKNDGFVLVGSTGMLGQAFKARLADKKVVCLSGRQIPPEGLSQLVTVLRKAEAHTVLNCAADTNVEGAEVDQGGAFLANAILPDLLAQACEKVGARLVQFSSTGCYGNYKTGPYTDFDELVPTTIHHRAKAAGEVAVRRGCRESLILRLGWLYGGQAGLNKNFVWARLQEASGKSEMASDPTQFGCPTNVDDVCTQTLVLLDSGLSGTFNCVANGAVSRFDYVEAILKAGNLKTKLIARPFERRAKVSPNETAKNQKLDLLGLDIMPVWDDALARYVKTLASSAI